MNRSNFIGSRHVLRHALCVQMISICCALTLFSGLLATDASAMPALARHLKGQIVSIDTKASEIEIASIDGKKSMRFSVEAKHTRIHRDGHRASIDELKVGDAVGVYYRGHYSEWIATEITATSPPPKHSPS